MLSWSLVRCLVAVLALEAPEPDVAAFGDNTRRESVDAKRAHLLADEARSSYNENDIQKAIDSLTEALLALPHLPSYTDDRVRHLRTLAGFYEHAYKVTGDPYYLDIAIGILDIWRDELPAEEGGRENISRKKLEFQNLVISEGLREYESLLHAGEEEYDDGNYAGAVDSWLQALALLPETSDNDLYRKTAIHRMANAHLELYISHGDVRDLHLAKELYEDYREGLAPQHSQASDARVQTISELLMAEDALLTKYVHRDGIRGLRFVTGDPPYVRKMSRVEVLEYMGYNAHAESYRRHTAVIIVGSLVACAAGVGGGIFLGMSERTEIDVGLGTTSFVLSGFGGTLAISAALKRHHMDVDELIRGHNRKLDGWKRRRQRAIQAYKRLSVSPSLLPGGGGLALSVPF